MSTRKFSDISERSLLKQIQTNLGILYILTEVDRKRSVLKFDRFGGNHEIQVIAYVNIYGEARSWLKSNGLFDGWINILPITEVGEDFIASHMQFMEIL